MFELRFGLRKLAGTIAVLFALGGVCQAGEAQGRVEDGLAKHVVESGGVTRTYAVWTSHDLDRDGAATLILEIHGSGSNPEQQQFISGLTDRIGERNIVVVYPVAIVPGPVGLTWNVPPDDEKPDDVQYLLDIIDDAAVRYGADGSHVYVAGFSGGARLASELASRHGERVAAFAAVGGLRSPLPEGTEVPVIAFHGTSDPINPWNGGGASYWGYGVERALSGWEERDHCTDFARSGVTADIVRYSCRRTESPILELYRFEGGHVWPGSAFEFPAKRFGEMPEGLDATGLVLEFFARFGLEDTTRVPTASLMAKSR